MLAVGPRVTEAFAALLALEGFLPGVKAFVLCQMVLVFERLGADVAWERALA